MAGNEFEAGQQSCEQIKNNELGGDAKRTGPQRLIGRGIFNTSRF